MLGIKIPQFCGNQSFDASQVAIRNTGQDERALLAAKFLAGKFCGDEKYIPRLVIMLIGGLQKMTLIDFPDKVAATVFTIGCNFRCPYCYNSELVMPEKIKQHPQISEADFFSFLKERKDFLEGVCVTGGEPTLQADLPDFLAKIKKLKYAVKLDTNGSQPAVLTSLIKNKLLDYIAMDIKGPIEKYKKITGMAKIDDIKKSVKIIQASGLDYEFRTTAVPTILRKDDFCKIARWLQNLAYPAYRTGRRQVGSKRYFLQQFRPEKTLSPEFLKIKPYELAELEEIRDSIKNYFTSCEIR